MLVCFDRTGTEWRAGGGLCLVVSTVKAELGKVVEVLGVLVATVAVLPLLVPLL